MGISFALGDSPRLGERPDHLAVLRVVGVTECVAGRAVDVGRASYREGRGSARVHGRRQPCPGVRRGAQHPLGGCRRGSKGRSPSPAPGLYLGYAGLDQYRVQRQPFGRLRKRLPRHVQNDGLPLVAGRLPGFLAVCLEDGDGDGRPATFFGDGALAAAHRRFFLPVPLGDRRSSIWGDSTARIYSENVRGPPGNGR